MKKYIFYCAIYMISQYGLSSTINLSGFVRDAHSNEVLIGANIIVVNNSSGTTSDNRGYFSLKVETPCLLRVSYIGYEDIELKIAAKTDTLLSVALKTDNKLQEITVIAERKNQFEINRYSTKDLTQIPMIGGKPDVIKFFQFLPGVQTPSEGMSLMMVRGGEPGQNQYLLDNVPVIYVNHLGGLLSVFNPDMINSIDFYRGSFPAKYGGKLSSIVDITQREGNKQKHQGSFSLGITDAAFTFEGPLIKKKVSYMITARKTFTEVLLGLISTISSGNDAIVLYGFHDINAKLNWKLNDKNNINFNIYQGDDYLSFFTKPKKMKDGERNHINQQWGNWLVSSRCGSVVNARLYTENIVSYSRYRNRSGINYTYQEDNNLQRTQAFNRASVDDFSYRTTWKYNLMKCWNVEFGGQFSKLFYEPNYNYLSTSNTPAIGNKYSLTETSVFIDNKVNLNSSLIIQPSFRVNNLYNDRKNFFELEPRFNLTYRLNQRHNLNLNYMRVSQNSHLIFTETEILKREVWLPATVLLPPAVSNQYSLSWIGSFTEGKYVLEASLYYKQMQNLITLKEGYENMLNIIAVENKIETNGSGTAYGAELMFKKQLGK